MKEMGINTAKHITTDSIESATQVEIIKNLVDKLKACYVFPDIGEQICSRLQMHVDEGDYSEIMEADLFALALTLHLQEVNHDEHLWVRYHPESLPETEDQLRLEAKWQEERELEARLDNFGLNKVERLPGNIGYLNIKYLHRQEWAKDTITAAMSFLANTSALILDLRECTGGYPNMIAYISSYLFGDEPILLSSIYWRDDDMTQEYWTSPHLPSKRYVEKPVFVLTSKATFSAGEGFASILQSRKRATVIGEKTDGGAHPGASYRIHPHFEAFIPIGYSRDPVSGKDLEGTGVTPDISVPKEHAILAAYHKALQEVILSADKIQSGPCEAISKEAQKALKDLTASHKFCPKCGYQNPLHREKCKNCDEPLLNQG